MYPIVLTAQKARSSCCCGVECSVKVQSVMPHADTAMCRCLQAEEVGEAMEELSSLLSGCSSSQAKLYWSWA